MTSPRTPKAPPFLPKENCEQLLWDSWYADFSSLPLMFDVFRYCRKALASIQHGAASGVIEFNPRTACERAEAEFPDAHADQSQRGMADGSGHAADLPVFPLDKFKAEPAIGN